MLVTEIESKSILTKSGLPESDYCINPYVGCSHGCVYCYARFMKRFTGHREPWGQFVDVKINAVELLRTRLKSMRKKQGTILLGSVTDAYQPLERRYELTRGLLQELLNETFSVSVLTKSDLVVRDVDLLRRLRSCTVGLTITTLDEQVGARLEPRSSSTSARIEALRRLHDQGVTTYAFLGPILPHFTDLRRIFERVSGVVDTMWGEVLNTRGGAWKSLEATLEQHWPQLLPDLEKKVQSTEYWNGVEEEFGSLCDEFDMPLMGFYRH